MKNFLLYITITLLITSCNSSGNKGLKVTSIDQNNKVETVDPEEIHAGAIQHDTLSEEQVKKITLIQSTFAEVLPVSLDKTLDDFKRDIDVDSEIKVWLNMVDAYNKYLNLKQGKLDLNRKQEVFNLILSRSMMPANEAIANVKPTLLTEKEVQEVLRFYTTAPVELKVISK